jgi:cytochrome c oxidase assembly factor CtaG
MEHVWTVLGRWRFDPVPGGSLIVAAGAYLWAAHRLARRRTGTPWPRRSTASFLLGVALVWVAVLGPFGAYDDTFFWAHMTQHIVLMMLAAPFLLLGSPVLLLLRISSRDVRRRYLIPVLRSRAVAVLTNPVVSWIVLAVVILGTHFTPFFEYSLRHPLVHDYVEHPLYLGAALLFYYPLLPGNPSAHRTRPAWAAVSLFLMMIPQTMTGFFIYATPYLLYPYYATVQHAFGPNPLTDQQLAGSLMWAGSMVIDSAWVSLAVLTWLHSEEERSPRLDLETLSLARRGLERPQ